MKYLTQYIFITSIFLASLTSLSGCGGTVESTDPSGGGGSSAQGGSSGSSGSSGGAGASGASGTSGSGGSSSGTAPCKTAADCGVELSCQTCPDGTCAPKEAICKDGKCGVLLGECKGTDPCNAQDAKGEGACEALIGVRWNGGDCEALSGCSCAGSDCDKLFMDHEACLKAYVKCYSAESVCKGKKCGDNCNYCPPGMACPFVVQSCDKNGVCGGPAACQ